VRKLLLEGSRGGRSERDRDVQQARAGLKAECRRLMIEQPELARTRNAERTLWHRCVYDSVKYYTRAVSSKRAQIRANRDGHRDDGHRDDAAARDALQHSERRLAEVLRDSSSFYQSLVSELRAALPSPSKL